jgi:hypothetical protein
MAYPTVDQFRTWANITDTGDDNVLAEKLTGAIREVERHCGRRFVQDSVVSAQVFYATDRYVLALDAGYDISTATGLIVKTDEGDDGTYETTWTISTDFVLEPLNGRGRDGSTGWPYTKVVAVGSRYFPIWSRRPSVQVTAKWGWETTPAPVVDAVLLVAAESWKLKEAPLGVTGFGDFGVVRVRDNPIVARKLAGFAHPDAEALIG